MAEETATVPTVDIDVAQERIKPRLVSLLLFDYFNQTASKKVNLLGVFDRIYVNPETKKTHSFGVFIRTARTFDGMISLRVFSPTGKAAGGFAYEISQADLPDEKTSQVQVFVMMAFETPVEGTYWLDVAFQEQSLGGSELLVEFQKGIDTHEHTRGDA